MSDLAQMDKYLRIDDIPTFDAATPATDAFRAINAAHRGGFLLLDGDKVSFVDAASLAETSIHDESAPYHDASITVRIGQLCRMPGSKGAVTLLGSKPITMKARPNALFEEYQDDVLLVEAGPAGVGVLFREDSTFRLATRRIYFICEDGHRNVDPDHGTCSKCPKKIVGTVNE